MIDKKILIVISFIGLGLTLIPSFFVFYKVINIEYNKILMLIGTLLWIFTAPFWMNEEDEKKENENAI